MTRGLRKGLTRDVILTAAFEIIETEGSEALTMRRLGRALDVAAMAIYNHFSDREHLLDAMAEAAFSEIPLEEHNKHWKNQIKSIAGAVGKLSMKKPAVFALCMSRPNKPKAAIRIMSKVLEALRRGGLSETQTVQCYHSLLILLHGFPFWQAGFAKYCSAPPGAIPFQELSVQELDDLTLVHNIDPSKQLEASVALLLDGFESRV